MRHDYWRYISEPFLNALRMVVLFGLASPHTENSAYLFITQLIPLTDHQFSHFVKMRIQLQTKYGMLSKP